MTKTVLACAVLLPAALVIFGLAALAFPPTTTVSSDDFVYFNPCTNENIHVLGTTTTRVSFTAKNDIAHVSLHISQKGTGVGLTSGATYKITGEDNEMVNVKLVNNVGENNAVFTANVIGKGSVGNEHLKSLLHVTVNANGTATVNRTSSEDVCH